MPKMTRYEEAAIYLRSAFAGEDFTFEDAKEYLKLTDFGILAKNSWNSMIKKGIIISNENDTVHFSENNPEEENAPVNSAWTNSHRRHFVCEDNADKSGYGDFFGKEELASINEMYHAWKDLGEKFQYYGCRRINLPEVLSEGLASALFGWARTNNLPLCHIEGSADLVDVKTGDAIQVKGISLWGEGDGAPTSFGPNSKFDRLIVMCVRLDEDKAYFYEMNAKEYKDWKVNGQMSLKEQQAEGRRPRLLLMPIIREQNIQPFAVYDFNESRT